jgi:CRP-like cAMP-binding protein
MIDSDRSLVTERVLALARLAPFQILSAEELSLIALAGREEVVSRRTVIVAAGEQPGALYVPLSGELELAPAGPRSGTAENPARAAALALLGEVPLGTNLVAPAGTELLVVPRDALVALLEERGQLCRNLLAALAARLRAWGGGDGPTFRVSKGPLSTQTDLFARMLVFRKLLGPGGSGMSAVARLARVARELRLEPGATITPSADQADLLVIMEGSLQFLRRDCTEHVARAGEVVGLVEAVVGVPLPFATEATALVPTAVLAVSAAELAQAIEDEDLLRLALVRGFAAELAAVTGALLSFPEQDTSKDVT